VHHKKCEESIGPPVRLRFVPSCVERGDMVGNGETEVGNGHQDWQAELGNQQPNEARLENIGGEEGEEHNDEGENQTNVLNHKDDKEDDALKAKELGEGVDEEVDDEEAVLDGQHRLVASKREFHLQIRSFGSISTTNSPQP